MRRELPLSGVSLWAALAIDADGRPVYVTASGLRIHIEVPDLATGLNLVRVGSPTGFSLSRIRKLGNLLKDLGLQLTVSVNRHPLLELGHATSSRLLSLIGLKQCQIRPFNLVRSIFARKPLSK